jgi:CSLREA domain-containing protein
MYSELLEEKSRTMKKYNFGLLIAMILAFSACTLAATFMVNNTGDTLDAAPGDGICADSSSQCTLRAAIGEANALAGADTINVPAGTYTISLVAALEDANAGGDFDITQDLTIIGAGQGSTIVQAAVAPNTATERVFHNVTTGVTLTLQKMTVQNGRLTGTAGTNSRGGGIRSDGILNLSFVTVQNNTAAQVAGGIYSGGTLVNMHFVTATGNTCTNTTTCFGGGYASLTGTLNIDSGTFTGNTSTATTAANSGVGAGLYAQDTNTTINNSVFNNNTGNGATTGGSNGTGLRFNSSVNQTVVILNTTVSNNVGTLTAGSTHSGVGIAFNISAGTQTVTMTNVTVSGNTGSNSGAGISVSGNNSTSTLNNCNVTSNILSSAAVNNFGGGISLIGNSTMTINSGNVNNNQSIASGSFAGLAGAIYNQGGNLILNNTNVTGNSATFHSGIRTLAATTNATTTLNNSTVNNNTSGEGSGVVNIAGTGLTTTTNINNTTISGNTSTGPAGGIEQFGTAGTAVTNINNSTIAGNTANSDNTGATDNGGGVFQGFGTINIKNSLVADNVVGTGSAGPDCSGTVTSADYNLIENTSGCAVAGVTTNNIVGVDPSLAPLAFNGGLIRTQALNVSSAAINAGDPTNCQTIAAVAVANDERGLPRSQGGARCDIGAFERGGFVWTAAAPPPLTRGGEAIMTPTDWNDPANWAGGVVPGSNDYAIFGAANTNNVTVSSPVNVKGIIYGSGYNGTMTLNANLTVSESMQMNGNNIVVNGANNLIIGSAGTLSRTSGFVTGNLRKDFIANGSFTFPVGVSTYYIPATINVTGGTGSFTVKPNLGFLLDTSNFQSLFANWTLTPSGITSADVTFNYPDTLYHPNAVEANFQFARRSGVVTTFIPPTTFNTTTNVFTLNGVTTFSDWGLGVAGATAANGTIGGRVLNAQGQGIKNVSVVLTGGNLVEPIYAVTGTLGYYQFPDVPVGTAYVVSISSKRFTFSEPVRLINLNDSLYDADFIADAIAERGVAAKDQ